MPSRTFRLLILLAVALAIAAIPLLRDDGPPDWSRPLKVVIYPENADASRAAARRLASLDPARFSGIEQYFAEQAARYDLPIDRPFEIERADPIQGAPGEPDYTSPLAYLRWGLSLRWWYWRRFDDQGLEPDIVLIARYREAGPGDSLHSLGIPSMNLAFANLQAGAGGLNDFLIAHELLHTVGANDLYDPRTGLPHHPEGYVEPNREPRYPQPAAELMAGRIPIAPGRAVMPKALIETRVGETTAREIGWRSD